MTARPNAEEIIAVTKCSYCGASPGEPCVNKDGKTYRGRYLHRAREQLILQAFRAGYHAHRTLGRQET